MKPVSPEAMPFGRLLFLLLAALLGCAGADQQRRIVFVTTTSIEDTGLLEVLVRNFEQEHPAYTVAALAVGTGQALQLGRSADADVLLTHDSTAETEFVRAGYGIERRSIMSNDFVLLGPASDPAGIRGRDAVAALRRIAERRTRFVSRADDSGTHRKERQLWGAAGVNPSSVAGDWYIEAGVGQGETLLLAGEKRAYALCDRGTHLEFAQRTRLTVLVENDPRLHNSYGVVIVRDAVNPLGARLLADWLTSAPVQQLIAEFGVNEHARPLFTPAAR